MKSLETKSTVLLKHHLKALRLPSFLGRTRSADASLPHSRIDRRKLSPARRAASPQRIAPETGDIILVT